MKKIGFFLLIGIFACFITKAQWYNPDKIPTKARMIYNGAMEALNNSDWDNARILLNRAINAHPKFVEAWLTMGGLYGQIKQYDSAVLFYEKGYAMDTVFSNDLILPWSINLAGLGKFEEANELLGRLLKNSDTDSRMIAAALHRKKTYQFAVDFESKNGRQAAFNPHNLGDSINSPKSEYYPSFTIDDSLLVFTRRGKGIREDFFITDKTPTGYTLAKPVLGKLNEEPAKGGTNISPDGEWLLFAGNFSKHGFGNFDIYLSYATPDGWSAPYNLGEPINTEFWESSPSISPDKQTLYFSSNRPGGLGGKDLYSSSRQANGQWTPAENMGPNFNTSTDDLAPFIHSDNQTLFFTSGGHLGYGGSDIFVSRKGPGGKWSIPENLGYPINTIEDEGSMIVTADGKKAYYAAVGPDTRGGLDLYSFELPTRFQPKHTLWIKGTVIDANTLKGIPSAIELKDVKTGQLLEKVITSETGNYLITLPVGHDYSFTVNRKGYLYYSDAFLLASNPKDSIYRKNIALQPISLKASSELKNILFETGSFNLKPGSFMELDEIYTLLVENPSLKVEISGHTDNVGKLAENVLLSTNRSKSVVEYLVKKGIEKSRLSFKGLGSSKPIADNQTEGGRTKNRRTEMLVIGF